MRKPKERTIQIQYHPDRSAERHALNAMFAALEAVRVSKNEPIRREIPYEKSA